MLFWTAAVALSAAVPVRMPGGAIVNVGLAPLLAAAALGGPTAAVVVAAVGTLEWREIRGLLRPGTGVPWYGTLYNHAEATIPAAFAGIICMVPGPAFAPTVPTLAAVCVAGLAHFTANNAMASEVSAVRDGRSSRGVFFANSRQFGFNFLGMAPLAWLMASMYVVAGPVGVLPFAVPLLATRSGYKKIVEIRDMFTQTVKSLAVRGRCQGPVHGRPLGPRPAHRQGPGRGAALFGGGARSARVGRPAARHRQDRHPRRDPAQAGRADQGRAHGHERASGQGRGDHPAGRQAARLSCRSFAITTNGSTARATPTASSATTSRAWRGSCTWRTHSRQ